MSKKSGFRGLFDKQHGKRAKALLKCASQHLYQIHWSLPSQLNRKKSFFLTWKTLVLLLNTLAADEKYPVLNRDNLAIPIQMQLSQKQKTFWKFFAAFLKFCLNFKDLETNMTLIDFLFSKLRTPETLLDKPFAKGPLQRDFLDIYLTTFSEAITSEIINLWGSSFSKKYSKFKLDFKNWQAMR